MQSVLESISSSAKRWFVSMNLALRKRLFVSLSAMKLQCRLEPNFVDGKMWNEQNKYTWFMLQPQWMRCHNSSMKRQRETATHRRCLYIYSSPSLAIVICHKVNSPHCLHSNWISFIASAAHCRWKNSFDFMFKLFETTPSCSLRNLVYATKTKKLFPLADDKFKCSQLSILTHRGRCHRPQHAIG